jgi:Transcription elongation factor
LLGILVKSKNNSLSHDRRIDPVGAGVCMRGSRIQAMVRELNNEKIDIINSSEQSEVLISRALSPAKPLDLYIDDDRSYCIAIFDDDDLELAMGRAGVKVNLAAKVTNYKIDALGKNEYERKQKEQETLLAEIENVNKSMVKGLNDNEVFTVSDLLNSSEESLIDIDKIDEESLEGIYENVQEFIEKNQKLEAEKEANEEASPEEETSKEEAAEVVEEKTSPEEETSKEEAAEVVEEKTSPEEETSKEEAAEVVEEKTSPEEETSKEEAAEVVDEKTSPEEE